MPWKKKVSIPTTPTFLKLFSAVSSLGVSAVCSKDMPFCLLSPEKRSKLATIIQRIYKNRLNDDFVKWLHDNTKSLFIVWVAGFKPRGDDSRPDRGLVPLLRMVVGEDNVDVLTIVYGPCKKEMLTKLEQDMWSLARENGLWQSVLNYSNGLIVDTRTSQQMTSHGILIKNLPQIHTKGNLLLTSTSTKPLKYGEHDVDTVLHEVFYLHKDEAFFEGLCNPPGGNWSGISLFNFNKGLEVRWVSLPRVSGEEAKRPDHLFQIMLSTDTSNILTVESKDTAISVEKNIGGRLKKYIIELVKIAPNIFRSKNDTTWRVFTDEYLSPKLNIFSVVAFRLVNIEDLYLVQRKSNADIIIAIEFLNDGSVCLHTLSSKKSEWLNNFLRNRIKHFNGWFKIKVH